ncbi:MAG: hypothetical protein ICV73_20460 [Acetobacteraceae bacterium]|nr:hypothetical protein [Acetobacteraceae bacterium]
MARRGARWLWHLPLVAAVAFLRPASAAGLFFPDVDQLLLPVLGHRSVVTHSVLLPVLALALAPSVLARLPGRSRFGPEARAAAERSAAWFMAWFLLGLAIHLMADVAPLGCRGYALAKLPGVPLLSRPSSLPCAASLLWFAANAVAALVLCEWLLRREGEAVTAARYLASGVVLAVYVLVNERRPMLLPELALAWAAAALFARSAVVALERRGGGLRGPPPA